ncbi:MAG: hypothetical protein JXR22_04575 [Prolixibacteraceae bacterium]|nr:hypothetical protein [Prolixibacteraceae bacterium]
MATKKPTSTRRKQTRNRGFLYGLILGILIAAGAVYYYNNHYKKSELERKTEKLEKQAKKELEKAEDGVKKLFDK